MTSNLKLMIPGPVQPEDEVLKVMGSPVQAHYGPSWTSLYNETTDLLKMIFKTQGDVFLLVGSGSSAIDACIGSLVPSGEKIVVGINGYFGERMKEIALNYGLNVVTINGELGQPLRPEDFDATLDRNRDARAVAVVHLETSTTIVNPLEEIAAVCKKHRIPVIADTVSSLGGLPFKMDEWGIDLCATASQKCLGAPPGLAPVAVGKRGWEAIDRNNNVSHGWYLNLRVWRKYKQDWGDWHPFPSTMATNNVLALRTSLKNLLKEGIESRLERYRELALRLREGLRRIGMPPFTPDEILAPVLTAAYTPKGVSSSEIVQYLDEVHRIKIVGGLSEPLKNIIIRIGHMAPTVSETDIDQVLDALSDFMLTR